MKKIIVTFLLSLTLLYATEYKVVFDLTSGDEKRIQKKLISNLAQMRKFYQNRGDTLRSAVVISGDSFKFFDKNAHTKLSLNLKELSRAGTEFKICSAGMRRLHIPETSILDYVSQEFNSESSMMEYLDEGYYPLIVD